MVNDEAKLLSCIEQERRWYLKARHILIYHTFMQVKHGTTRPNGWTVGKTAEKTSLSTGYVSESIQLAMHYLVEPNLSRNQALEGMRNGREENLRTKRGTDRLDGQRADGD